MMPTMQNKKPLYIPSAKKWKGLKVFCYKCKTNVYELCKETGKPLNRCPFGDKHAFKVYISVPNTENERKTKTLETRDINQAILEAIAFEKEVKEGRYIGRKKVEKEVSEEQNKPLLLVNALARYVGFLNNENVPEHRQKQRTEAHIKAFERSAKNLIQCWTNKGHDIKELTVEMINDKMVGEVFRYLEDKNMANRSFNKCLSHYASFLKWYSEEYEIPVKNWFNQKNINRKPMRSNPQSISFEEFEAVLNLIRFDNGSKEVGQTARQKLNMYRPWLADGFRLALETGRRREEVATLKYNEIATDKDGTPLYIKIENYKVNRIQKHTNEESKSYIYIPVTDALFTLLKKFGYEENKNTDKYILAPDIIKNREKRIAIALSSGFTHYYKQTHGEKDLTFKCLRKTYITSLDIYMRQGINIREVTGHAGNAVIDKHYLDPKVLAKSLKGFKVFSNEPQRNEELEEIRNESKVKQNTLER
jgi:integrase